MKEKTYRVIRSRRKTLAICVETDGTVIVRAPARLSLSRIEAFVEEKREWIAAAVKKQKRIQDQRQQIQLTPEQVVQIRSQAREDLTQRCRRFEPLMGVACRSVRGNGAKPRWGSCSSRGTINFTYRLWFAPEPLRDYVVVHELAHLIEMNHSERFWSQVERVMPDYRQRRRLLREFQQRVEITEGIGTI